MDNDILKSEILQYLQDNGQHTDMVDVAIEFSGRYNCTVDAPCIALNELVDAGKVKRIHHSMFNTGYQVL